MRVCFLPFQIYPRRGGAAMVAVGDVKRRHLRKGFADGRDLLRGPDNPTCMAHAIGRRRVYLIEGVFDWLTAVSWRLAAFSTCGTDFPMDRLGWLAGAKVVFGVLDADKAGREASGRRSERAGGRLHCRMGVT